MQSQRFQAQRIIGDLLNEQGALVSELDDITILSEIPESITGKGEHPVIDGDLGLDELSLHCLGVLCNSGEHIVIAGSKSIGKVTGKLRACIGDRNPHNVGILDRGNYNPVFHLAKHRFITIILAILIVIFAQVQGTEGIVYVGATGYQLHFGGNLGTGSRHVEHRLKRRGLLDGVDEHRYL